jgi:2-polyprenyl-6-hydroxyphenyl methylase/3-demethylubiquinone-9 3-methyltransferase
VSNHTFLSRWPEIAILIFTLPRLVNMHSKEVARGERFKFGKNWSLFLSFLDEKRIKTAEQSLSEMLELPDLKGKRFLDIGSGSGLFSLAARRLGATVHSFDYDPDSVACTNELKRRFFPGDLQWTVEEASVLEKDYLISLGTFDIVYSWGVLHHTGQMWQALDNIWQSVADEGKLFIAIYNDMGSHSTRWRWIKRTYNAIPDFMRVPFTIMAIFPGEIKAILRSIALFKPREYISNWTQYNQLRGMSRWRDMVDWVGGYPYEVAKPEQIFDFYRERGFTLTRLKCGGVGLGCNEFVFES